MYRVLWGATQAEQLGVATAAAAAAATGVPGFAGADYCDRLVVKQGSEGGVARAGQEGGELVVVWQRLWRGWRLDSEGGSVFGRVW